MSNQFKLEDGDDIVPLHDMLVNRIDKTKITEECFKNNFLPFFSGQAEMKDVNTYSNFYNNWIQVAGTPMNEVEVIDNSNNVIFTVPSLLDTNIVKVMVKPNKSFSQIFDEFNLRKKSITGNSASILQNDIDNKLDEAIDPKSIYNETEKKWQNIFSRYGINSSNNNENNTKSQDSGHDDLIYE